MILVRLVFALLLSVPWASAAAADDWAEVLAAARGQRVHFNAWGGSEQINGYIDWVRTRVAGLYGIELRHVKVADTAEVVARVLAERTAGRTEGGSVDLVWINGENFAAMKAAGLLGPPFAAELPNAALVDTQEKPTTLVDFGVPTDGLESPWGMAQLVFIHDAARLPDPPRSMAALADWAAAHPGRLAYPQPPAFLGTTFLKQALAGLVRDPAVLAAPAGDDAADVTAPLWAFLDGLHPHLWRGGAAFPAGGPALLQLFEDGEVDIAFTFNPGEASAAIEAGRLPDTVRTFVLAEGTIGNTHFLAIPFNAAARAGALVVADFLLSPEAQAAKEDPRVWGDPTVLAMDRLTPADRALFDALPRGIATLAPEDRGRPLPEPHASWTEVIESGWLQRYGG
jgi:putative thiamine transport system substrate-binding protein